MRIVHVSRKKSTVSLKGAKVKTFVTVSPNDGEERLLKVSQPMPCNPPRTRATRDAPWTIQGDNYEVRLDAALSSASKSH